MELYQNDKKTERANNMVLTINPSKFGDFVVDNQGEIHAPRYFKESELMELSKEIALIIAKRYIETGETVIKGTIFHNLLDEDRIDFDRNVVKAVLELQENDYFEMNI